MCDLSESVLSCPDDCESVANCGNDLYTEIEEGTTCNDCDGCLCGDNIILNETECKAFIPETFTGMFP